MPRITLIGYRGTGKSTVAALLGDRLGCGWCDADTVLEQKLGCSIAAVIRERGEKVFRDEEAAMLAELLGTFPGVLATGGGAVLRPANRDALGRLGRPIVWLTAPADVIRRRLATDPTTAVRRPALAAAGGDPLAEVSEALVHREPLYRACADLIVDASEATPADLSDRLADWLETAWPARAGAAAFGDGDRNPDPGAAP